MINNKLSKIVNKSNQEVMNMAQLKAKVLNHLTNSMSQKSPDQLAEYMKQFQGTQEDASQSIEPSGEIQPLSSESQIEQNKDLVPKKSKSGFLPRKY